MSKCAACDKTMAQFEEKWHDEYGGFWEYMCVECLRHARQEVQDILQDNPDLHSVVIDDVDILSELEEIIDPSDEEVTPCLD